MALGARPRKRRLGCRPLLDHLRAATSSRSRTTGEQLRVLWRHKQPPEQRPAHRALRPLLPDVLAAAEDERNDDWLLDDAFELIRLLPRTPTEIGFTGGEPTLYGEDLIELLTLCRNLLAAGRRPRPLQRPTLRRPRFAAAWAAVDNPNMMVGIPLYGAEPALHDYVVQAAGRVRRDVRGILNLGQLRQRIEIRVVLHKQTAPHLARDRRVHRPQPALRRAGRADGPGDDRVRPRQHRRRLDRPGRVPARSWSRRSGAARSQADQDDDLQPPALSDRSRALALRRQSISDWKNEYHPECSKCSVADQCGGFFFSAKYRISDHIKAIPPEEAQRSKPMLALTG